MWYSVTQLYYIVGTIVTYNCSQGYNLAGDTTRTCIRREVTELSELGTEPCSGVKV